jgi:DNA-binding winged helix-turn-helix (wHTH) protein
MKVFGEFEFDEESRQLRRGSSTVSIRGQCLDLLLLMIARPGEIISREEIARVLWPDSHVDFGHSLDVLVNRLRRTLGDNRLAPRYLETVPRKGYRFVAPVSSTRMTSEASATASRMRMLRRYVEVAVLAALLVWAYTRTRYQKFVPPQGAAVLSPRG